MAPAAPVVVALVAVSAAASAAGAIVSGIQQAEAAEFQADLAKRDAELARQTGIVEEAEARRRAARLKSAQRAAAGASGLLVEEGSPVALLAETAEDAEFEALSIRFNSELARSRALGRREARRFESRQALTSAGFRAGTSLLSGAADTGAAGIRLEAF